MTSVQGRAGEGPYPRALADVGATNARFALEIAPGQLAHRTTWSTADFPDFTSVASAYLEFVPVQAPRVMAVAIACPVSGDLVRMTNTDWEFSVSEARTRLGLDRLVLANDFSALSRALPRLESGHRRQVGDGSPALDGAMGLLGPGSGLGMAGLLPAGRVWVPIGTEGGHASFSPCNEREVEVLRFAWRRHPHVSFERLLSGPGIELIHAALLDRAGAKADPVSAADITRRAMDGSDALCVEASDCFCAILGTAAGNLALTIGATGGIYIGGGIVPRLGTRFDSSPFRARFEDKGRFGPFLRDIPTYVITAEDATLRGVSAMLDWPGIG